MPLAPQSLIMNDIVFDSANLALKENQIVSLDYLDNHLYGEVIQLIRDRQLCWFRPLCLILSDSEDDLNLGEDRQRSPNLQVVLPKHSADSSSGDRQVTSIDLQSSSDLLWPDSLFRPALDTEIINFLPQLTDSSHLSKDKKKRQKCLNKFVYLVWQAHQDKF